MPSPRSGSPDALDALLVDLGSRLRRGVQLEAAVEEDRRRCATGIPEVDRLLGGGFPRRRLCEIAGAPSSGRTSLALGLLAVATRAGECAAVIDRADAFDPASAAAAGVDLDRVLWVRAPSLRDALRATERLLQTDGFTVLLLDIASAPQARAQRAAGERSSERRASAPQARAQRAAGERSSERSAAYLEASNREHAAQRAAAARRSSRSGAELLSASAALRLTRLAAGADAALVLLVDERQAGSNAEVALELEGVGARFAGAPALLEGLETRVRLVRHRAAPAGRSISVRLRVTEAA